MASSSGEQLEARVANNPMRYERWLSLRSGRAVGELKKPEYRRMGTHLRRHYGALERAGGSNRR
jgi:hypothetical protein